MIARFNHQLSQDGDGDGDGVDESSSSDIADDNDHDSSDLNDEFGGRPLT